MAAVKHVALLIPRLDRIGGAERQMMLLAKGLARRGWRVSGVALSGLGAEAADELHAAGAEFLSLEMRKGLADPRGWLRFHRWVQRQKPQIVHAHLPHAAWLARWSRLAAPVRVVIDTLHSSSTGSMGRRLAYRCSNWLPDRVTAVSEAVAEAHLAARMTTQSKLAVLPNGVDVEACRPDADVRAALRREMGLEKAFLWIAVGRLEAVKDYPTLLWAMAETPETACLAIAGAGPLESELRGLAKALGLEGRVRFLGFEPEARRWMQAADGFVLSSLWEGLPMALLEAAACGLPAVATDVAGTRAAVIEGRTGLLTAAEDAKALAEALTRLMRMPAGERAAMGQQARRLAMERYSLEAVLDRWEALYEELLERHAKPRRQG